MEKNKKQTKENSPYFEKDELEQVKGIAVFLMYYGRSIDHCIFPAPNFSPEEAVAKVVFSIVASNSIFSLI